MTQEATIIKLSNLGVKSDSRWILRSIDLAINPLEIVTLIGPNGAGKTTLILVLLGLLAPSKGTIWRIEGLKFGYMPQKIHIEKQLPITVSEFIALAGSYNITEIKSALSRVGAISLIDRNMSYLSGGELQRVLLARALIRKPNILVLDEPAQGVDVRGQKALYSLIASLRDELGAAVFLVSHDLHWVMAKADRVICLQHHICCQGHPELVSKDPTYQAMLKEQASLELAPYTHIHDHEHAISGEEKGT